mgnify:CR=1 FL=1|jgi:hypothetical protein|tara:strand:- start:1129 stop:1398 length:270 start_codon:yes stop_codon:yes gene_type:complete
MAKGLKTGGRTKGTSNKLSIAIRETLADILIDYSNDTLRSDLNDLKPTERIKAITNLYRLLLPPIKPEAPEDNEDIQPFIIMLGNGNKD